MRRSSVVVVACAALAGAALLVWWMTRGGGSPEPAGRDGARSEAAPSAAAADAEPESRLAPGTIKPRRLDAVDEPAAPESAPEAAMDPSHLYVTGKVIDERRRAAPGATVEVVSEGRDPLRGKTGVDGRFRIDYGPKPDATPRGAVSASDAKGRVAVAALHAWTPFNQEPVTTGNVLDVGLLPLADAGAVTIRVTKDGAPVARACVYVGTTSALSIGPFLTDADGIAPRRLPEGQHVVTAFTGDMGFRGEARAEVPRKGGAPVEVSLAPAWRLTVVVKDAAGKPVAGQRLSLMSTVNTDERSMFSFQPTLPYAVKPTDAEGRSVVAGLSPERGVTVTPAVDGQPSWREGFWEGSARVQAKPGVEEVVLTLGEGGETFTFPIVADETDGPADGTELKLSVPEGSGGAPPPSRGKVAGRSVVIDGVTKGCFNILATADDGSRAILRILGEARNTKVGSEAKFKKPRTLFVTAHDRAGNPLAGEVVQCRTPGNVAVGKEATIGADGAARIEDLFPQTVDVTVRRKGDRSMFGGRTAGSADLTKGDARVELIVEQERKCVLHVTVDGEKRLPATFGITVMGDRGMFSGEVGGIEEDPEEAVLRFLLRPDPKVESVKLSVMGKGCPAVTVPLVLPKDDAVLEGTAAFVTGGKITIHVLPPSDNIHGVGLEAWSAERSSWGPRFDGPYGPRMDELGKKPTEIVLDTLGAGRYRARDSMTGVVSEPFDLAAGASAEITIDLSRAGAITGRVEGPVEGEASQAPYRDVLAQRRASVFVEGAGLASRRDDYMGSVDGGISVRINSEFKARVPGDRPVTFRVKHPVFSPDPEKGSATVTAPGSSVVLKLVKGAELRFRVPGGGGGRPGMPGRSSRVLFFEGKPSGEPIHSFDLALDDGAARVGGYKPGKYTLFFDVGESAPLVLEGVELGEGVTDLGDLKFPEGATLRVKVLAREGQDVARITVSASPLEKPQYRRSGGNRGESEVLVKGLGPGKFKVDVRAGDFRAAPSTYEVVSTGSGEIPLTHDAR